MQDDELEQALGERVRQQRFNKGLTQVETADRANVSLGALKHLESGSGATVRTLVRVLRALGIDDPLGDAVAPAPEAFNPLDLLEARERAARAKRPQRVRPARDPATPHPPRSVERARGPR
ncbi:MAG TPA: helix-turn-helix domain-containing protein [Acidimicrobiales bacterium]|jgi:transcriptional regulator with XRE-family HTH domain